MAFPQDNLGTVVQLKINDVWTNVVRYDDETKILESSGIQITRGSSGLQEETPASQCRWTWSDPNGVYNNENPRSEYYGLIPRNTPVRVYIPRDTPALYMPLIDEPSTTAPYAQTTDKAALDITGDIELRIEFEPSRFRRWASGQNRHLLLASKYTTAAIGQRSWHIRYDDMEGILDFVWSTTGVDGGSAACTAPIPSNVHRLAVKITMDVDNGAGGLDVKFYTSTTGIGGTYTQLGSTVTLATTTNIFASTTAIQLGTVMSGNSDSVLANAYNFAGRIYGFQLYNGIGGTLVADADFTTQSVGASSFADGLGNTWTVENDAEITDADYQFYGELSAPVTTLTKTANGEGTDVTTAVDAGGIIRRLSANKTPLQSAIYLAFSSFEANGWWTGEDASTADTSSASSAVTGVEPATLTDITFAGPDATLAGSAGVMELGGTGPQFVGICKTVPGTTETHFIGYFKFPSVPLSTQTLFTLYSTDGTVKRWDFSVGATNYILSGVDGAGTSIVSESIAFGAGAEPNNWTAWHLQLTDVAGTIGVKNEWTSITNDVTYTDASPPSYAGVNGTISKVVVQGITALSDVRIAHLMASNQVGLVFWTGSDNEFPRFSMGYPGETACARWRRITALMGVSSRIIGSGAGLSPGDTNDLSEAMGPQPIATPLEILYECAKVDGGVIMEATDREALELRQRSSLYNQYGMALTWAQLSQGVDTTPDDTDVANDIILNRRNGGQARATLEYGPLSIQAPPAGINVVPDGPEFNNHTDARLPLLVQHLLHVRTWPTARYPSLSIGLHRSPFTSSASLLLAAQKTDVTDIITVTSLPMALPPEPLYLMVKGINQQLYGHRREIQYTLVPYGPYRTSELTSDTDDEYYFRACQHTIAGVVQTQVNTAFDDNDTSISIKTLSGPLLSTTAADFVIKIGGERMLATAVSGATSPQTVTVTRGLDGYTAAHAVNDYVYIEPTLKARL